MSAIQVLMLQRLAAGLCNDAAIRVAVHKDTWAWEPRERILFVAHDDLQVLGLEACAGIVAHEVGHAFVTRYHMFESSFASSFPCSALMKNTLNSIEDARADAFMCLRYPGVEAWLWAAARCARKSEASARPYSIAFLLECARGRRMQWPEPALGLPEVVSDALVRTRVARRRYAEGFLPHMIGGAIPPEVEAEYATSIRPVVPGQDSRPEIQAEIHMRVLAHRALRFASSSIIPEVLALWELDVTDISDFLTHDAQAARAARRAIDEENSRLCRALVSQALDSRSTGERPSPGDGPQALSRELLEASLQDDFEDDLLASPLVLRASGPGVQSRTPHMREQARQQRAATPEHREAALARGSLQDYHAVWNEVRGQVNLLASRLEEILAARRRMRERTGYPTGHRLDLRRAMSFDADPRTCNQLWKRATIPDRTRSAFSLLVDLSGSMSGAKADAALRGTIVFAETLARLGISFSILGFQDEVIPFLDFGERFDDGVRATLAEMPLECMRQRPNGHNRPEHNDDGPCLLESGMALLQQEADRRVLVAISDGAPAGCRSEPEDLTRAVQALSASGDQLTLIGVGIGSDTGHVSQFYPRSVADVPVGQFAATIVSLLESTIRGRQRKSVAATEDEFQGA